MEAEALGREGVCDLGCTWGFVACNLDRSGRDERGTGGGSAAVSLLDGDGLGTLPLLPLALGGSCKALFIPDVAAEGLAGIGGGA